MKIVFFGTPYFAVPSLNKILSSKHEVLAVVTQPDRPRSNYKLLFSPVKEVAVKNNITVLQFENIRAEGLSVLKELNADIGITVAYGQILSQEIIDVFPKGIYNVHASLLPKYRGSSPIQWAVLNGEKETGITIMRTDVGLDTGDIILAEAVDIGADTTSGELFNMLAELGAELIVRALDMTASGAVSFNPQNHELATKCKMLNSSSGAIDWHKSAQEIHNLVRAFNPAPIAYADLDGEKLKIYATRIRTDFVSNAEAGTVLLADVKSGLVIQCGNGVIEILTLQLPNKKALPSASFLMGRPVKEGSLLKNGKI